jgi:hypothetical protein
MKGKRIFELLNELTVTEHRQLMHHCSKSEDKRLQIFYKVLKNNIESIEEFNLCLIKHTTQIFKEKTKEEIEHICRRNLDFYALEIEGLMIQNQLISDEKLRNIIIAESLEKSANPYLLDYYYSKSYASAKLWSDSYVEIKAIRGKIRLNFNTQTEAAYKEAVKLNEQLKVNINTFYHDKYVDYYNNISNIYIESNLLINVDEEELIKEIEIKKKHCNVLSFQIGYLISQARLCYKNEQFFSYINEAYKLLNESDIDERSKNILKRKILFLELIIGFYFNKNQQDLMNVIDEILKINTENKFIDNNTLFHKLILLITCNQIELAQEIIASEKNYFKGKSSELKEFIIALIYYKKQQINKCIKLINALSYCSNYFIALFSKLMSIKIHIELKNPELTESLLYNTERFIKRNSDKYTVYNASLYALYLFKIKNNKKTYKKGMVKKVPLSPFYVFILQD